MFILIQIIGGIGYFLLSVSYYRKNKKDILFIQILSYMMFVIHYYLLGGITGSICNLLGLIGFLVIYFFEKNHKNKLPLFISPVVLAILIISLLTFKNIYSIFPIFASISVLISFLEKDVHIIRLIGVFSAICWLVYAIYCDSYVAIVFEVLLLLSTFVSVIENNRKK